MRPAERLDGLDDSFHTVDRVLASKQERTLRTAQPDEPALEALARMVETRYSQLPVCEGDRLVGVFSLWSLCRHLLAFPDHDISGLRVGDALASLPEVRPDQSLLEAATRLRMEDAVLVRLHDGFDILTDEDLVTYFHAQAKPFIVIQEVELALRHLIESRLTDGEIEQTIAGKLKSKYGDRAPAHLHELDFSDYWPILKEHWARFAPILGDAPGLVKQRLDLVRERRNAALHFREHVDGSAFLILRDQRDWLYRKLRRADIPVPREPAEARPS